MLVVPWFGRWSRFASCGAFGLRGIGDSSRIPKKAWRIFYIFFFYLGGSLACPYGDYFL